MNDDHATELAIEAPHAQPSEMVLRGLDVELSAGLTNDEVIRRRQLAGSNVLAEHKSESALDIFVHQFKSPVVALLAVAAGLSLAFGDWLEALAILLVLAVNAAIGFATELKAQRSMDALRALGSQHQRVRREGHILSVPASELVPGDIVLLEEGDVATADIRLVTSAGVAADESTLTGESVPIAKSIAPVVAAAVLGDRFSMIFKGTSMTRGSATGVITATGAQTELGRIADLAASAKTEDSPLTKKLARLSNDLILVVSAIAATIGFAGIVVGQDPLLMAKAAISLAVAAIPEGLPVVATLVLARGMLRMAERNAVIERLSAVETLGATTVILTDKTGTLTENRMTVTEIWTPSGRIPVREREGSPAPSNVAPNAEAKRLFVAAALCNTASLGNDGGKASGDPMEVALLEAARHAGLERGALATEHPESDRVAFDSNTKIMATAHRTGGLVLVAVKGAPEVVLARSSRIACDGEDTSLDDRTRHLWLQHVHELGREGLRVLAIAERRTPSFDGDIGHDLVLLGLVALQDPPRADVPEAIRACKAAGIKVVMVTGDHAGTASAIARAVGFGPGPIKVVEGRELDKKGTLAAQHALSADVLARVTPRQKLELVEVYQAAGHVVAMTGDGVNDAPALKKADIGVAMGLRGTQVARQAAAMVLRDDAFPTIVEAVRQGRVIFGNIRRFVVYLLACNLSEVLVVSLAVLAGMPLPLQPIQILFMNVVTDVFPALALAMGEGEENVLLRPPRPPDEPLIARRHWVIIVVFGLIITAATLAAMQMALQLEGLDRNLATTTSFLTLALAQLWFVFNMGDEGERYFDSSIVRNPYVWAALALCVAMLAAAVTIEPIARVLKVTAPDATSLAIATGASLAALGVGAVVLKFLRTETAATWLKSTRATVLQ